MARMQRRFPSYRTYPLLVVILMAVMLGCNSRVKEMRGVTVSYRGEGDITIRARGLVIGGAPAEQGQIRCPPRCAACFETLRYWIELA